MRTAEDAALLEEMRRYAIRHAVPIIREDAENWLRNLVTALQPEAMLEVGTAIGYSTLVMATALEKPRRIISFERDEDRYRTAVGFLCRSSAGGCIELLLGDVAHLTIPQEKKFDFIFLDGAKGQYKVILQQLLPYLQDQATIVADNTGFRGWVEDPAAVFPRRFKTIVARLREYRQWVYSAPCFSSEEIAVGDGVTITRFNRMGCNE